MCRRTLVRTLALASLAACGAKEPDPAPRWVELARGFHPSPLEAIAARLEARVQPPRAGRIVHRGAGGDELWFELPLPRALWSADEERGVWRTPLPSGGALLAGERSSVVLADGEEELGKGISSQKLRAGRYALNEGELLLTVKDG